MLSSVAASLALAIFVSVNVAVAYFDLKRMQIQNGLILTLLLAYLILAPLAGFSIDEMASHGLLALCTLVVSSILFGFGWIGGGDTKLVSVSVLWMGFSTHAYLTTAAFVGLGLTLTVMAVRNYQEVLAPHWPLSERILRKGEGVPYGFALALSALLTISTTPWVL